LTHKIYMYNTICIFDLAVAGETIENESQSLITFHIPGTFEIFIKHRADQIL